MGEASEPVIGVDIGTSRCRAAVCRDGKTEVIPHEDGSPFFPSFFFRDGDKDLCGNSAKSQTVVKPLQGTGGVKQWLGLDLPDSRIPEHLRPTATSDGDLKISLDAERPTIGEILAAFAATLKANAERHLKAPVDQAVFCIPDCWDLRQRLLFSEAVERGGLHPIRLINDTSAAAFTLSAARRPQGSFFVASIGTGFSNFSVCDIRDTVVEVRNGKGSNHLCGQALTTIAGEMIHEGYLDAFGELPSNSPDTVLRIDEEAQRVLRELNTTKQVEVRLPYLPSQTNVPHTLQITLSRQDVASHTEPVIREFFKLITDQLAAANRQVRDLRGTILAGEVSKSFLVSKVLEILQMTPVKGFDSGTISVEGAALMGAVESGELSRYSLYETAYEEVTFGDPFGDIHTFLRKGAPYPVRRQFELEGDFAKEHAPFLRFFCGHPSEMERPVPRQVVDLTPFIQGKRTLGEPIVFDLVMDKSGVVRVEHPSSTSQAPRQAGEPAPSAPSPSKTTSPPAKGKDDELFDPADYPSGYKFSPSITIVRKLGMGGFSYIYQVKNLKSPEEFEAFKILKPEQAGDEQILKRFQRSAEAMIGIQHANIAKIYEYFTTKGLHIIRMEFIDGMNLERLMDMKKFKDLELGKKIGIANGIAKAVMALRKYQILHADLKPANIMITQDYKAKLIDFELSKFLKLEPLDDTKITGTPKYFSPEHLAAKASFGEWSDIFSLGLIMYKMLTGEFPRKADRPDQEYAFSVLDLGRDVQPIHPCKLNPDLPKAVGDAIVKAIQIKRASRYKKMEELLRDIGMYEFMV